MTHAHQTTHLPADHGLTGLGLIMQLGGSFYAAMTAMLGFTQILLLSEMKKFGGGGDGMAPWLFLLMAVGVARSLAHRAAGTELLQGAQPGSALRRYLWVAAAHTAVWLAFLIMKLDAPTAAWAPVTLLFAAWPVALAIVTSRPGVLPTPDEHGFGRVATSGDRGFEGMAVLMTLFGLTGALFTGLMLMAFLEVPSAARDGSFTLFLGAIGFLLVRSLVHAHAGFSLLGNLTLDRLDEGVARYVNLGVISSLVFGAVLLMLFGSMGRGGGMLFMMPMLIGITLMLLAWPLAVRSLTQSRRMELYAESDAVPTLTPAPDQGRTTLGWFLLAMGAMALAGALPAVLFTSGRAAASMRGMGDMFGGGFAAGSVGRVPWLSVVVAGVQLWAAVELIFMTPRHRAVATGFGVLAVCVTLYDLVPVFEKLDRLGAKAMGVGEGGNMMMAALALGLVTPLVTLALVNRDLPPPRPTAGIANVFS